MRAHLPILGEGKEMKKEREGKVLGKGKLQKAGLRGHERGGVSS